MNKSETGASGRKCKAGKRALRRLRMSAIPAITDPDHSAPAPLTRARALGLSLIRDPRDLPFLKVLAWIFLTLPPGAALILSGVWPSWWFAAIYLAGVAFWMGPFVLLLHNVSHRPFFKREHAALKAAIDWIAGPLCGLAPFTYFSHHIGIHHPENNLAGDVSSTLRFQRDSLADFLRYFGRFLVFAIVDVARYLWRRKRRKLFWRALLGEAAWWAAFALAAWWNWRGALIVFLLPMLFVRFGMMSGNWAQHAFIDAKAPANNYRNSITCINTLYNRRCFNDGYHIGHHLVANRHWTEMPGEFLANLENYEHEDAIVFQGLDYHAIWFLLMTKQYGALARRMVDLGPPRAEAAKVELLRNRVGKVAL